MLLIYAIVQCCGNVRIKVLKIKATIVQANRQSMQTEIIFTPVVRKKHLWTFQTWQRDGLQHQKMTWISSSVRKKRKRKGNNLVFNIFFSNIDININWNSWSASAQFYPLRSLTQLAIWLIAWMSLNCNDWE